MLLQKEWFSAVELAELALPGMPSHRSGIEKRASRDEWRREDRDGHYWRKRDQKGGGIEYHYSVLPQPAQVVLVRKFAAPQPKSAVPVHAPEFKFFAKASDKKKDRAAFRLGVLAEIDRRTDTMGRTNAVAEVAAEMGVSRSSIHQWRQKIGGLGRENAVAALVDKHEGRSVRAACSDRAWEYLLTDYLRPEQPPFSGCWERLKKVAQNEKWKLPSPATMLRRIQADVPAPVMTLCRQGAEAHRQLMTPQERDRGFFHALEAVVADGHKWDNNVIWPDGTIGRPMMVAFQDLYSGLILSWRVDRSENKEMVRLAFGDLVQTYGIPKHCYLDNGRAFASKWLTGGIQNRFRFKYREEEPHGILPLLGVQVHWALPYHGQSKPIERAFGEFANNYASHPLLAGSAVGNSPMNKPSNYGETAIPLDLFLAIANQQIADHNAREGRRSAVCKANKWSFQQAFNASYQTSTITKASPEHLQYLLLAAEGVRVNAKDSFIRINEPALRDVRFVSQDLIPYRGCPVVVRFDPQKITEAVYVYTMDGKFITTAKAEGRVKFDDAQAAPQHAKALAEFCRGTKAQAENLLRMSKADADALTIATFTEAVPKPETKTVRPYRSGVAVAVKIDDDFDAPPISENYARYTDELRAQTLKELGFQVIEGGRDDD